MKIKRPFPIPHWKRVPMRDWVQVFRILVLILFLPSCSSVPVVPGKHVILVNKAGIPLKPEETSHELKGEEFSRHIENILENIKSRLLTDGKNKILIFVHGGLNSQKDGLKRVKKLHNKIAASGYYPIFINWNSGLISSYWDHLMFVRQGKVHPIMGPVTAPFYGLADIGRGITGIPIVGFYQMKNDLSNVASYVFSEEKNAERLHKTLNERYQNDLRRQGEPNQIAVSIGEDNRKAMKTYFKRILYFVTFPVTNLVVSPFVDAMGKSAWINMSRRTKNLFRTPQEFEIGERRESDLEIQNALDASASGAISKFMNALSEMVAEKNGSNPESGEYEITLIGHSMGTIVLNEMIRNYDNISYQNIVYMAAACTIRDFSQSVIPYLEKSKHTQFYNLVLHPKAETGEFTPQYLDLAPRGSLLIWIDNFLSTPETILDRTLGKWNNIIQTTHLIPKNLRGRVHIKAFGAGPSSRFPEGNPQKHGDFSDETFWSREFWEPKK